MPKGIILHVKTYDFDKDGKNVKGTSVQYITSDNLDPVDNPEGSKGYMPIKESLPYNSFSSFPIVPGIYELEYNVKPTSKGLIQKLDSVRFICEVGGEVPDKKWRG